MAVVSTPVAGRLRVSYLNNAPDLRINGVNPTASAIQGLAFIQALSNLQTGTIDNAFVIVESDLAEA